MTSQELPSITGMYWHALQTKAFAQIQQHRKSVLLHDWGIGATTMLGVVLPVTWETGYTYTEFNKDNCRPMRGIIEMRYTHAKVRVTSGLHTNSDATGNTGGT